ncbi:putative electron transfer flavoprotein FixA [Budvicia aquatica]|uniref:putative electron transfer flavoprotein FixA n=1 Tax=Budvicia aquatica TaxID=82979 RepID=UPI002087F797|nr:putative electron transfer flavoprotein FixA [Budvicia aquatica]GKX52421.1 protein FixA [Budvicia aquatica]
MRVIACCKLVAEEQDISIKPDRSLDTTRATYKISPFDLNAIEAAVEAAAQVGDSTVEVLSVGGKVLENAKLRKDILSRGPDILHLVMDEKLDGALPYTTAHVLAAAATKIGFDLIICGDGSGDLYAQQTALLIGQRLRVPVVNAVSRIVSITNQQLVVERTLEDLVEVLEISLPAVLAVTGDINVPQIPAMKAILSAGKKPVSVMTMDELGLGNISTPVVISSVKAPEQTQRQRVIIEGDGEEQIATFIETLRSQLK